MVAAKDHRWLLLSRRRQLAAHLLAVIAISDQADTAIDGRFNRENPDALEHSRTAHRVEAHRLSAQCSGRRVDRGSQSGLDKGSS